MMDERPPTEGEALFLMLGTILFGTLILNFIVNLLFI